MNKHVPIRTCIGTGVKKPKNELIRLVRLADGSVVVDPKGKLSGRGANLDTTENAFDMAVKKNAIKRALMLDHNLTPQQLAQLKSDFMQVISDKQFRPQFNKSVTVRVSRDQITDV